MRLFETCHCDVLVVGAGIAGISAALEAAEAGRNVILTSSANIFSGSSFYPGTWGLGLIGPADDTDCKDLQSTILSVGCGMADPDLVQTFSAQIRPAIDWVKKLGVRLRKANQSSQQEYVPCFDHKHRDWNGIEFGSAKEVFSKRMDECGVYSIPYCSIVELVMEKGQVCGAIMLKDETFIYISCAAVVLATGGYGGLFRHRLCTEDITGFGQALALKAGCRLVNMEFMQMMPGYISPAARTIYNEKVFRFTKFYRQNGESLFPDSPKWQKLLEIRSTHGPFTSRLPSREVDLELSRAFLEDERGITAIYSESIRCHPPEFVKTYFDWLKKEKNLTMEDPVQLGIFAHAANGGIHILPDASTGVPGLFACGEVTGGMHGADRIGGLSTANGLTFGRIAGRSSAVFLPKVTAPREWEFGGWFVPNGTQLLEELQELMFRNAMILRTENGLSATLKRVQEMEDSMQRVPTGNCRIAAAGRQLEGQLLTAQCILHAALARKESRGSHYREDYPRTDPSMGYPLECVYSGKRIHIRQAGESEAL